MFTPDELSRLCQHRGLSQEAQAVLAHICSSPPARRVGSGRKNVPVLYPSRKMGVIIQAESYKNELAGVYEMEHDPAVLAFYDQPPSIKLQYQAKNGRTIGVLHTPDYFVIRADSLGWEEWKMEEDLMLLAEKMPQRYMRHEDGSWSCPPGEQVAAPLGFYYRVRSSREIHWVFQRNLRFLSSYWQADAPRVSDQARDEVVALVTSHPGITVQTLLTRLEAATSDDVYRLCAEEHLYVDLYATPLAEPERVHVFRDQPTARAWETALRQEDEVLGNCPHPISIEPGATIVWDGKPCTILYQGQTTTTLLTEDRQPLELTNAHFQALVCQGKVQGASLPSGPDRLLAHVRERLLSARPTDLAEANRRYATIQPALHGHWHQETTTPACYRQAAQQFGCGYVGLLPRVHQSGNRRPRFPEDVMTALNEFIEHDYETHKQKRKAEVYGELVNYCRRKGLVTIPSYKTFIATVNRRPRYQQIRKRAGARAAYPHEPMHWELAFTFM